MILLHVEISETEKIPIKGWQVFSYHVYNKFLQSVYDNQKLYQAIKQ
jgi:hypothetical protein